MQKKLFVGKGMLAMQAKVATITVQHTLTNINQCLTNSIHTSVSIIETQVKNPFPQ